MKQVNRVLVVVSALVTALCTGALARAQQIEIAPESARSATVRMDMVRTGATGVVEAGSGSQTSELFPGGESGTLWGWVDDNTDSGPRSICPTGSAAGPPTRRPWEGFPGARERLPLAAWNVVVQLEEARVDRITLNLTITRMTRGPDKTFRGDSSMRTITLVPQQPYVVGVLDGTDLSQCHWANVMVQLRAEPSSILPAASVLGFDVWLKHEGVRGEKTVESARVVAREGDQAHVGFKPLTWVIPGTSCTVRMDLTADIRGRIRQNGLIDLAVTPQRTFSVVLPERVVSPNYSRESGRKTLVAKPNEAVEFVLPPPVEQFQNAPCGAGGTSFRNFVDLSTFFQGQKTSLTVSVRKE